MLHNTFKNILNKSEWLGYTGYLPDAKITGY